MQTATQFNNFINGDETRLQVLLGCHPSDKGYQFSVWAPHAQQVWVIGDFNDWQKSNPMTKNSAGIWTSTVPNAQLNQLYKFLVQQADGTEVIKIDPMAFRFEPRPGDAAIITELPQKHWRDGLWRGRQKKENHFERPINIYEVHPNSWKQHSDGRLYTFADLQKELIPYVKQQGYNYIEFMPLTEHPLDASWGYQSIGYYAVAHSYGTPAELLDFVEACHNSSIGVLMDWVPGHFCRNEDTLPYYDGTPTYEYAEKWRADNRGWGALNFDLGKPEVQSFLISNALFWLDYYHLDGLRVDAVSNMLYRDYDRSDGEWVPDKYGGNRSLEGIDFLHKLNRIVKFRHPESLMVAEESSSQVKITGRIEDGGLGFDYKWNMGWMNDTLDFFSMDPLFRKDNFNEITFSFMYWQSENFILPLSHDEVVHGKRSLMNKMWGDRPQQFSQLRLLLALQIAYPGKKLLFMGSEYGQYLEWRYYEGLEWSNEKDQLNAKMQTYTKELNNFYRNERAFWDLEQSSESVQIIDADNRDDSVLTLLRQGKTRRDFIIVVLNFTPVQRDNFAIGVPYKGTYQEVFNSSLTKFGGEKDITNSTMKSIDAPVKNLNYQIRATVPGFGALFIKPQDVRIKPRRTRHKKS